MIVMLCVLCAILFSLLISSLINIWIWGSPLLTPEDIQLIRDSLKPSWRWRSCRRYPYVCDGFHDMLITEPGYVSKSAACLLVKYSVTYICPSAGGSIKKEKTVLRWTKLCREIDTVYKECLFYKKVH